MADCLKAADVCVHEHDRSVDDPSLPSVAMGDFYSRFFHIDAREAPQERSTYLFSLKFQTAADLWRSDFPEDQRARWTERMPAALKKRARLREVEETKARAAGIAIDEDYRDPPIPGVTP